MGLLVFIVIVMVILVFVIVFMGEEISGVFRVIFLVRVEVRFWGDKVS